MLVVFEKYLLLSKIELKKRHMYYKAKHLGFTDERVVCCSQELDDLLNIYQDKFMSYL
ncbi:aspartyl-phosphate phosphatase Spo0E family protein [Paenisporosarcina cavernae]|uniref:Aspartyl-phosphate phosphatase Spo0E family protein n=1 Tax=Paenisporosarcina cavernae TaxID=2320858 RepID=A0A385YW62_9BACL|nr:aspartyl-phosphate phosphatase Spo0E family protein [Paenisporosarcina cavernae]AYC30137.1 aspartyl-phosphate phosphatase Spo0E family protein [Paenisporosarcina cavernae]